MCYLPLDIASKIKTVIKGKVVKQKAKVGHKIHKPTRPMGMSDYLIALAEKSVRKVTPSDDAKIWADEKYKKNLRTRANQDIKVKSMSKKPKQTRKKK